MAKKARVEWKLRMCNDWDPLIIAYRQGQLGTDLGTRTVNAKDPIWVATLPNNSVLTLGPKRSVNPSSFETFTLFYSTPGATVRTPKKSDMVIPIEAKHHKYAHTIEAFSVSEMDLKEIPDQDGAERLYNFWDMVDRATVNDIRVEACHRIDSKKMMPEARLMIRAAKIPPAVEIRPLYAWKVPP